MTSQALRYGDYMRIKDHRCQYCKRAMHVDSWALAENPYCNTCLGERLEVLGFGASDLDVSDTGYGVLVAVGPTREHGRPG